MSRLNHWRHKKKSFEATEWKEQHFMHAAPLQITQIRIISLAPSPPPCEWHIYAQYINDVLPVLWLHHLAGKSYPSSPEKNVSASLLPILTQTLLIEGTICLCITNPGERTENTYFFWYKPNMSLPCIGLYYTGYVVKVSYLQKCNVVLIY